MRHSFLVRLLLVTSAVTVFSAGAALAQFTPDISQGDYPGATYLGSDYEHVDPATGRVYLHIPLLTDHSQRGDLNFSYNVSWSGTGTWVTTCYSGLHGTHICGYWPSAEGSSANALAYLGPAPVMDGGVTACTSSCAYSASNPIGVSDGGVHVAYQLPSQSLQRTTDGSGILVSTSSPYAVTDKLGRVFTNQSFIPIVVDRNGNRMTMSANGPGFASGEFAPQLNSGKPANSWTLTDTVGRSWSYAPAANANGCPSNVGADRAEIWTTPGPSGSARAFEFCFSPVSISTNLPISQGSGVTTQQYVSTTEFLSAIVLPDGTNWQFQYNDSYGDLTKLVLPTGGTITYQYTTTTDPYVQETSLGFFSYIRTVTSRAIFDGTNSNTWSYAAAPNSYPNPFVYTVTDPLGNGTVYTGGTISSGSSTAKIQYYAGSASSGTLLKTVNKTYLQSPPGTFYCWLPALPLSTSTTWPNGQSSSVTLTYDSGFQFTCKGGSSTQSTYGSVISTTETDYGGATLRQTNTEYEWQVNPSYLTVNWLSFPYQAGVTGTGGTASVSCFFGTAQSCTTYGYDGLSNQTSVTQSLNTGQSPVTHYAYNGYGMPTSMTDPKNNTTTYGYDSSGACMNLITNPLGQTEHFTCDSNTEQITDYQDQNSQHTQYNYDVMLRPTQINYPDGGITTFTYYFYQNLFTTYFTRKMTSAITTNGDIQLDGLGREIRRAVLSGEPLSYNEAEEICYSSVGLVGFQAYPFQDSGWVNPPNCNAAGDSYTYDALGRPTKVTYADGSYGLTSYSGNCATGTDEQGKTRQLCYDGLERLTSVTENPGGLNYTTNYTYNALGNLTSLVQNGSHNRSFAYDSLSRLTSATNPESGTTSYTYDATSNVATRLDARSITTTYTYDVLNRLGGKSYSDGTPAVTFYYDCNYSVWGITPQNPIGRLCATNEWNSATNSWVSGELFSYDPMGRVVDHSQCTPFSCAATPNSLTYAYDLIGDMTSYTNGAGITFTQSFNVGGRVTQLASSWVNSQHPGTLASGIHYIGNGALAQMTYGNGLTGTNVYNSRLQPCLIDVNSSGALLQTCNDSTPTGNVLDFWLGYNAGSSDNGNVINSNATGAQSSIRTYSYDQLNRLATMADTVSSQPCKGLSWTYDAWGNRTDQTVTSGTCNTFHQLVDGNNHFTASPYQYDAAGNMIHDASHSYTYDAENRITKVDGGSTATYQYDPNGRRVSRVASGVETDYLYDLSGHPITEFGGGCGSTCWARGHVYLSGQMLAEYGNSTTYFVHQDHLGSTRLMTGYPTASVVDSMDYLPFGEQIAGSSGSTHKFTGQERDSESNLDNFGARYLSSQMGRFQIPDPANVAGDLDESGNPQSWNAYAYVRNNPLSAVDPNGEDCIYIDSHNAGNSYVQGGDCTSDTDNGIFVNGHIDSFTYDGMTGTYTFSGTNYPGDPASILSGSFTPSQSDPATDLANAVNALNPGGFIMGSARLMAENAAADLGGRLVGLGIEAILARRAAQAAEEAVDLDNLTRKITRQMESVKRGGWSKQTILDTIRQAQEAGTTYPGVNKSTGGATTEFVSPSTGRFVVVDNATREVIQISGPGFRPNYLLNK